MTLWLLFPPAIVIVGGIWAIKAALHAFNEPEPADAGPQFIHDFIPAPLALLNFDPTREGILLTPRGVELDLADGCPWSLSDVADVISTIEAL